MNIIKYIINTGTREPQWVTMAPSAYSGKFEVVDTSSKVYYMLGWTLEDMDLWLDRMSWTRKLHQRTYDSFSNLECF